MTKDQIINDARKGDFYSMETMQEVTGERAGTEAFQLAFMGISTALERVSAERGERMIAKYEKGGLRVLTDSEATEYAEKKFKGGMRALRNNLSRMNDVDRSRLSTHESAMHDRRVEIASAVYASANTTYRSEVQRIPVPKESARGMRPKRPVDVDGSAVAATV